MELPSPLSYSMETLVGWVLHCVFPLHAFYITDRETGAGFGVMLVIFFTFIHANLVVCKEAKKGIDEHVHWSLISISVNILFALKFVDYVLDDSSLFWSCILLPPGKVLSFYHLIWLVGINDFCLKFGVIFLKIFLTFLPISLVPAGSRGRCYQSLELFSHFHRQLATITPWVVFFFNQLHLPIICTTILYLIIKIRMIINCFYKWKESLNCVFYGTIYGVPPSNTALRGDDGICSICQDNFLTPRQLSCHHVFCNHCLQLWLDVEKTCPMCRAVVTSSKEEWKDGLTDYFIQLF